MATTPKFIREFLLLLLLVFLCQHMLPSAAAGGGEWKLLNANMGVSAMHMQLLSNDRVIIFDRTEAGPLNITLPNNRCLGNDCTAHSVEYDVASNTVRPLFINSDTWCSSGSVMADGSLTQTGGWGNKGSSDPLHPDADGGYNARMIEACTDLSCDWKEFNQALTNYRWYATNHLLPDNRQIIIGGTGVFTYEFLPKTAGVDDQAYNMPFLSETKDFDNPENNLYPYVFLNVDENLFIFANNRAILFDYKTGKEVRRYPTIPGGDPRNYPSTGSAVMLPLSEKDMIVEVLVCGGAPAESFAKATASNNPIFVKGLNTCGRIRINDPDPKWEMETMPMARLMSDMVMLPNGNVLIINGASAGVAGWDFGREPVLEPLIYRPNNAVGSRFEKQNPSTTPRMYHSTAILLRDGRVLVASSNAHEHYSFDGALFPTDLTAEAFSPDYLLGGVRPTIISPASQWKVGYGQKLVIKFTAKGAINKDLVSVTMVRPPFSTHSFSMNQRLLILSSTVTPLGGENYQVEVGTPASGVIAPPGFYLLFVVHQEVPSEGIWIQIN